MVIHRLKNTRGKTKFLMFPCNRTVGFPKKRTSPEFVRCNSGKQKHLNQDNSSNLPQVPSEQTAGKTIILTTASTIAAQGSLFFATRLRSEHLGSSKVPLPEQSCSLLGHVKALKKCRQE